MKRILTVMVLFFINAVAVYPQECKILYWTGPMMQSWQGARPACDEPPSLRDETQVQAWAGICDPNYALYYLCWGGQSCQSQISYSNPGDGWAVFVVAPTGQKRGLAWKYTVEWEYLKVKCSGVTKSQLINILGYKIDDLTDEDGAIVVFIRGDKHTVEYKKERLISFVEEEEDGSIISITPVIARPTITNPYYYFVWWGTAKTMAEERWLEGMSVDAAFNYCDYIGEWRLELWKLTSGEPSVLLAGESFEMIGGERASSEKCMPCRTATPAVNITVTPENPKAGDSIQWRLTATSANAKEMSATVTYGGKTTVSGSTITMEGVLSKEYAGILTITADVTAKNNLCSPGFAVARAEKTVIFEGETECLPLPQGSLPSIREVLDTVKNSPTRDLRKTQMQGAEGKITPFSGKDKPAYLTREDMNNLIKKRKEIIMQASQDECWEDMIPWEYEQFEMARKGEADFRNFRCVKYDAGGKCLEKETLCYEYWPDKKNYCFDFIIPVGGYVDLAFIPTTGEMLPIEGAEPMPADWIIHDAWGGPNYIYHEATKNAPVLFPEQSVILFDVPDKINVKRVYGLRPGVHGVIPCLSNSGLSHCWWLIVWVTDPWDMYDSWGGPIREWPHPEAWNWMTLGDPDLKQNIYERERFINDIDYDWTIFEWGSLWGFPPQIIKGIIRKESGGGAGIVVNARESVPEWPNWDPPIDALYFRATAFRYEPGQDGNLTGVGQTIRTAQRFKNYLLYDPYWKPSPIFQGGGVTEANLSPREKYCIERNSIIRPIRSDDTLISIADYLKHNARKRDDMTDEEKACGCFPENWFSFYPKLKSKYEAGEFDNLIAQTLISSSYGLTQMTYYRASDLRSEDVYNATTYPVNDPEKLFDDTIRFGTTNLSYLYNNYYTKVKKEFPQIRTKEEFFNSFRIPIQRYNDPSATEPGEYSNSVFGFVPYYEPRFVRELTRGDYQ